MTTTPAVWRDAITVNTNPIGLQEDAHVVQLADGYFVVWLDVQAGNRIVGQRYDVYGNSTGEQVLLGNGPTVHASPDITARPDGDGFVLVWKQPFIPNDPQELEHQLYDANGTLVSTTHSLAGSGDMFPVVASAPITSGVMDLVAWSAPSDRVKAQIVGPNGIVLGSEFTIADNPAATGIGEDLAILASDSTTPTFFVAWSEEYGGGDSDIKLARITNFNASTNVPATISTVSVTANSIESTNPELVLLANGNVLVSWTIDGTGGLDAGVRARIFTPSLLGAGVVINPLTSTAGNQDYSTIVALKDGGFVILWGDAPSSSIRGQRYSETAAKVGIEFVVATGIPGIKDLDATLLDDARFVVTWEENGDIKSAIMDTRGPGVINGTAGDDFIIARANDTIINGLGGNDTLLGYIGNDTIDGGLNDDVIDGGAGNDILTGGSGVDRVSYASAEAAVTVYLAVPTMQNTGGAGADTITGFENLTGSRFADFLYGTLNNNNIEGGDGDDFIYGGGGGGDVLKGEGGNDTFVVEDELINGTRYDGGSGIDTLDISLLLLDSNHVIDLGNEFWSYTGGSYDVVVSVENVLGGSNGETIYGGFGSNVFYGLGGDDNLFSREGSDSLFGGSGNDLLDSGNKTNFVADIDHLEGGAHNDTYIVRHAGVVVVEQLNAGTDEVKTSLDGFILPDNVENLELTKTGAVGIARQVAAGNSLDNVVLSAPVGAHIDGGAGNDTITGRDRSDFITGGPGADRIDGAGGDDTAEYLYSSFGVDVSLVRAVTIAGVVYTGSGLNGDAQGDGLLNVESVSGSDYDDVITGNALVNYLAGSSVNDVLHGAGGNDNLNGGNGEDDIFGEGDDDYISGGAGADTLDGGDGFDTADFSSATGAAISGVTINLITGTGIGGDADGDTIVNFEKVIATNRDDILISDNNSHVFVGGSGDDQFFGNGGNDWFEPGLGEDTVDGGADVDMVSYSDLVWSVSASLLSGIATSFSVNDTLIDIENITGTIHSDTLEGDLGAN
ncbi:MAG: hypothetical protein NWT00_08210, partial [Beijerinckiaceae bacterium]|nr:hypothetical protein [Beijerinckiaceae bacterium]